MSEDSDRRDYENQRENDPAKTINSYRLFILNLSADPELKEEEIVNKVGGRFKLSTLIQKRMVALNTGARPLVDVRGGDRMAIVLQEILQDKIYLDASGTVQTRGGAPGDAARRAMLTDISDAGGGDD